MYQLISELINQARGKVRNENTHMTKNQSSDSPLGPLLTGEKASSRTAAGQSGRAPRACPTAGAPLVSPPLQAGETLQTRAALLSSALKLTHTNGWLRRPHPLSLERARARGAILPAS